MRPNQIVLRNKYPAHSTWRPESPIAPLVLPIYSSKLFRDSNFLDHVRVMSINHPTSLQKGSTDDRLMTKTPDIATITSPADALTQARPSDHLQRPEIAYAKPQPNAALVKLVEGDEFVRAELEARVLAGQSSEAIAKKLRLDSSTVEEYERLYFPARPLLEHRSVIIRDYCRLPMSGEFDPKDVPLLWRYIGYIMGPLPLEELLAGAPRWELRKRGLRAYLGPRSRLSPEAKYAVEARILPQPRTANELRLLMQLQERHNA